MDKKKYLETLTEQVRYKKSLPLIEKELENHIEEQKADFIAMGMEETEAETAAVLEMGDPVEVGVDMDRIHRPKSVGKSTGMIAFLYFFCFFLRMMVEMGLAKNAWASTTPAGLGHITLWSITDVVFLCLITFGVCRLDYSRIGKWARELTVVFSVFMFVVIQTIATVINGSQGWLVLGGYTLDLRAVAYLFIPLFGGILYSYRGQGYLAIGKCLLWMIFPTFLIAYYPSFVTAFLMVMIFLIMLLWAIGNGWFQVQKKRTMGGILGLMVLFPVVYGTYIWNFGYAYHRQRLQAILTLSNSEYSFYFESLRTAFLNSRLLGTSEESLQALGTCPGTDLGLAYFISFYGMIQTAILVGVIVFMLVKLLRSTLRQKNYLGRIMGVGCILAMFVQMIVYVLGNLGICNLFGGVYCPFISIGSSGTVILAVLFGIVVSIYRYQNVVTDPVAKKWKLVLKKE